jgi:hypothetical protein
MKKVARHDFVSGSTGMARVAISFHGMPARKHRIFAELPPAQCCQMPQCASLIAP